MLSHNQIKQMIAVELRLQENVQRRLGQCDIDCHHSAIFACCSVLEKMELFEPSVKFTQKEFVLSKFGDLWHFYMFRFMDVADNKISTATAALNAALLRVASPRPQVRFDGCLYDLDQLNLCEKIKLLVGLTSSNRISIELFSSILKEVGIDWLVLYKTFVGKNVLELFRRDHGYRTGNYVKVWNTLRDEGHLEELLTVIDCDSEKYLDDLYGGLERRYPKRTGLIAPVKVYSECLIIEVVQ